MSAQATKAARRTGAQRPNASAGPRGAKEQPSPPPPTNRGVEITAATELAFSVHWLAGTTWLPFEDVFDLLHETTGGADFTNSHAA